MRKGQHQGDWVMTWYCKRLYEQKWVWIQVTQPWLTWFIAHIVYNSALTTSWSHTVPPFSTRKWITSIRPVNTANIRGVKPSCTKYRGDIRICITCMHITQQPHLSYTSMEGPVSIWTVYAIHLSSMGGWALHMLKRIPKAADFIHSPPRFWHWHQIHKLSQGVLLHWYVHTELQNARLCLHELIGHKGVPPSWEQHTLPLQDVLPELPSEEHFQSVFSGSDS